MRLAEPLDSVHCMRSNLDKVRFEAALPATLATACRGRKLLIQQLALNQMVLVENNPQTGAYE